jgi:hypothetical protein
MLNDHSNNAFPRDTIIYMNKVKFLISKSAIEYQTEVHVYNMTCQHIVGCATRF